MKKIMRKGFTLVELLVVLTVIGILTSVATISGREVSNIAHANKIVENFQIISAAMNMYYSDNTDACNEMQTSGESGSETTTPKMTAGEILTALKAYLKSTTYISAEETAPEGKFNISINATDNTWWLTYTLPEASVQIAKILANKAIQEGFVTKADGSGVTYVVGTVTNGKIAANVSVCYQVR